METEEEKVARLEAERLAAEQNQNQNQPTDIEKLIQQTVGEANRREQTAVARQRELEDELTLLRGGNSNTQSQTQVQNQQPITDQDFWASPVASIERMMNAQIAPIAQTAQQMRAAEEYNKLKVGYRQQYGQAFTQIEGLVDNLMVGQAPTHANIIAAMQRVVGQLVMSNPAAFTPSSQNNNNQNVQNNNPPVNQNNNQNNPPPRVPDPQAHLRSSQPPAGSDGKPPKRRTLTELERRVAKETGLSEDKYLDLLEKPNDVNSWREEKKK